MKKRLFCILLTLCFAMAAVLPMSAGAASGEADLPTTPPATSITVGDFEIWTTDGGTLTENTDYKFDEYNRLIILSSTPIAIRNKNGVTTTSNSIYVSDGVDANITLAGVNIEKTTFSAFVIADNSTGDVTLTLATGTENTLVSSGTNYSGLEKDGRQSETLGTLTICGDGKLTVKGGSGSAGIGCCGGVDGGGTANIVINGGIVNATGSACGIGNGSATGNTYADNIVINGGVVTTNGIGYNASTSQVSNIIITGGSVYSEHFQCDPTDGKGNRVYLNTIGVGTSDDIKSIVIDDVEYPTSHKDGLIYLYLTEGVHNLSVNDISWVMKTTVTDGGYSFLLPEPLANEMVTTVGDFEMWLAFPYGGGNIPTPDKDTHYTYAYDNDLGVNVLTILSEEPIAIRNKSGVTTTANLICVKENVNANIMLAGVNIEAGDYKAAFRIPGNSTGNVTITLAMGTKNILKGGMGRAGLQKVGAYSTTLGTLTIRGEGALIAEGGAGAAGIGGSDNATAANITIKGGTITAKGGTKDNATGSGIGAGQGTVTSNIIITGGSVKSSSLGCQPKDGNGNNVYLCTIENPDDKSIKINEKKWLPLNHKAADTEDANLYAYVPSIVHIDLDGDKMLRTYNSETKQFDAAPVWLLDADNNKKNEYLTVQDAIDAAEDGDTVLLKDDVSLNATLTVNKKITLDLNGCVLGMEYYQIVIQIGNDSTTGELTLKDSKKDQSDIVHKFKYDSDAERWTHDDTLTSGYTEVRGGVIVGRFDDGDAGGVYIVNGTFNMNSGTIFGCNSTTAGGVCVCNGSTFNMSGGSINKCHGQHGGGVSVIVGGTFNMIGGTIENCSSGGGSGGVQNMGTFTMSGDAVIKDCEGGILGDSSSTLYAIYNESGATMNANGGTVYGSVQLYNNGYEDSPSKITRTATGSGIESYTKFIGKIMLNGEYASIDDIACPYTLTLKNASGDKESMAKVLRGQSPVVPTGLIPESETVNYWIYKASADAEETKIFELSKFFEENGVERAPSAYTLTAHYISEDLADIGTVLSDLEAAQAALETALSTKADKTALSEAISSLNAAVSKAERAANSYTDSQNMSLRSELLRKIKTAQATLQEAIDALSAELIALRAELIAAIANGDSALDAKINALSATVNALEGAINSPCEYPDESIAELETKIGDARSAIDNAVTELGTRLSTVESDVERAQSNIGTLTTVVVIMAVLVVLGDGALAFVLIKKKR